MTATGDQHSETALVFFELEEWAAERGDEHRQARQSGRRAGSGKVAPRRVALRFLPEDIRKLVLTLLRHDLRCNLDIEQIF